MKDLTLMIDPVRPGVALIYGENSLGLLLGANARRIVACVNACIGISTEQLENFTSLNILSMVKKVCHDANKSSQDQIDFSNTDVLLRS